jgi:diaminopimelate epimerase
MKIHFTKMSGAGNDFVVVDNRGDIITDRVKFAIASCNRHLGIGADGLLLLEKSIKADFLMRYYNADGSDGGMCGNGGRCIAKFAYDSGFVQKDRFTFDALDYIYEARCISAELYELKMKNPADGKLNQKINVDGQLLKANFIDTGSPNSVIILDENLELSSLDKVDVFGLGREVRYHEAYQPKGVNVSFVSIEGANSIKVRTYERGVEDETLACGTGSIASAVISSLKHNWQGPVNVNVRSGEKLEISFERSADTFNNVRLKGSAKVTFTGEFDYR